MFSVFFIIFCTEQIFIMYSQQICNKPIQQIKKLYNKSATFHKILQLVVSLLYTRFTRFTTNRTRHRSKYKHVSLLANISRSRYVAIAKLAMNATRAPIANPPNNAQLGGIPYHVPPSYTRVNAIVWACGRRQTQTRVTTIHFS